MASLRFSAKILTALWVLPALALVPTVARADKNDLVLHRLGTARGDGTGVVADNQAFRSLTSELGVALAPRLGTGADTLGWSGFKLSADFGYTSISNDSNFWCATEESGNCSGSGKGSGTLGTVGLFARKGLWLPLPSFEVGAGAVHLSASDMWAAQVYGKFALHEGFHDLPIPSVAVRGAASRLMGSEQLDLTVASLDVTVSKAFGIGDIINLEPYVGWNQLWIVPRSEVLDRTPQTDALASAEAEPDLRMNFVFPNQDRITRTRFFAGVGLKYHVFAVLFDVNMALAGSSVDDREGTTSCDEASAGNKDACDAEDKSGSQQTYTLSLALDF